MWLWEDSPVNSPSAGPRFQTILFVGIAAGFLSGMFGVGGGILIVPGLVLVAKMDQRVAHGTSLAAVLPISASSLVSYWAHDHVDWRVGACLAVGALAGAVLGTKLLHVLPHRTLAIAFSGILVVTAIKLFLPFTSLPVREVLTVGSIAALVAIGVATGILAGLLGVGGGIVMVPAMMMLLQMPSALAKGTSVAVIIPTSIMGTYRNRKSLNVDFRAAATLGLGGIFSAIAGGWISARMSDTVSNVLFATLLLVVAVRLILQIRADDKAGVVH
ncbi:unannotated protein [freshwater metagenome]|uniref:Unannotated protein n=1 Tax=freshwater metagenome TaxID=449393 RepID=A0A6J6GZZ2_9ZZZZ